MQTNEVSRTTKRIVGLACSVAVVAILLWRVAVHRMEAEYREIGEQCEKAFNELATITTDAHANRDKLWEKHPEICIGLNMHVIGKVNPAGHRYWAAERAFLRHRTEANLRAMRVALAELQALDRAAKDIIATNSGTKLQL